MQDAKMVVDDENEELKQLRESFRQFTYIISHDLSAPMRTVSAFTKLLEEHAKDKLDEKSLHYLDFITKSSDKAQNMLTGLLQLSRLNTVEGKPVDVDTAKIVEECLIDLKNEIAASGAIIKSGTLPIIKGEPSQIKQVFFALISNAIKFTASGVTPELVIDSAKKGKLWEFSFKDNGIGIDPKFHKDIFNVFRRLHRDEEYPGIGMGLTLAKKIAEIQGGSIKVESEPGKGSIFTTQLQVEEGL